MEGFLEGLLEGFLEGCLDGVFGGPKVCAPKKESKKTCVEGWFEDFWKVLER